jgi:hypothetical protein
MARTLDSQRHAMIVHMIRSGRFTTLQIAKAANRSKCSGANIRKKLLFGSARPRLVRAGWPPSITPLMLDTLCEHLTEKPGCMLKRWLSFCGRNLIPDHQHPALSELFPSKVGRKRRLDKKLKNKTVN